MAYIPRLKEKFYATIRPALKQALRLSSVMAVPRIEKITINQGLGAATKNPKLLEKSLQELSLITGQKAIPTVAKKAISNFKLREGVKIGAKVTLRGDIMFEFLDRLLTLALPRIRDFRGTNPTSFDQQGNYNLGIKEQIIFPEISIDQIDTLTGMNITINTTAKDPITSRKLLEAFGFPFAKTHSNK